LSLLLGRRRVGKTALLQQVYQNKKALYLFISRKSEPLLCEEFADQIRTQLDIPIFGKPSQLSDILSILFEYTKQHPLTVILDEFQDIARLNNGFFSDLQNLWDQNRLHLCRFNQNWGDRLKYRLKRNARSAVIACLHCIM